MRLKTGSIIALGLLLAACSQPAPVATEGTPAELWSFENSRDALIEASCNGVEPVEGTRTELAVSAVSLGEAGQADEALSGVEFAAGWHLEASDPAFGGLSGLQLLSPAQFLAVSDAGQFVTIMVEPETGAPIGGAELFSMHGADGKVLDGKIEADAEGLALRNGLALVSFERDHRVLAFAIGECGFGARGIEVAQISPEAAGLARRIAANSGPEGLTLSGESLLVGLEQSMDGANPIAAVTEDGGVNFADHSRFFDDTSPLTGLDAVGGRLFVLHRDYNPVTGNHIILSMVEAGEARQVANLRRPLTVDNFEGIAAVERDGATRLFIISDDNFSDSQRTLLFAFDLED